MNLVKKANRLVKDSEHFHEFKDELDKSKEHFETLESNDNSEEHDFVIIDCVEGKCKKTSGYISVRNPLPSRRRDFVDSEDSNTSSSLEEEEEESFSINHEKRETTVTDYAIYMNGRTKLLALKSSDGRYNDSGNDKITTYIVPEGNPEGPFGDDENIFVVKASDVFIINDYFYDSKFNFFFINLNKYIYIYI